MSATLEPSDRQRLARILGLLGSDYAGERDAAGLAAHRFIRDRGLTWAEALKAPPCPARSRRPHHRWQTSVDLCLERRGSLKPWEVRFLDSLRSRSYLSPKQRAILREIAERLGVAKAP